MPDATPCLTLGDGHTVSEASRQAWLAGLRDAADLSVEDIAGRLARAFTARLHRAIGSEAVAAAAARNAVEPCPGVCHTHDFCDANVEMDEAMRELGLPRVADGPRPDVCSLFNRAWSIAAAHRFSLPPETPHAPIPSPSPG